MICNTDKRWLAGVLGLLMLGGPLAAAPADDAIDQAIAALQRGDGIAAEVAGKRALSEGASRTQVAALIGEGELLQGDLRDARDWLGEARFDRKTRLRGLHALARLELEEGNFPAAAAAFDRLLQSGNPNGLVWVDIGRMRYRTGQHALAMDAAREAVRLSPREPRALEFRAQLVRDAQGLRAALPLFRRAIETAPDDIGLLQQYAATLGDAGEHALSLQAIRQLLEKDGSATSGFYLQAVIAARAGQDDLARSLWWRTKGDFDEVAAGLLVSGILEYRTANFALAVEQFDELRRRQPFNSLASLLFARALVSNGEANVALDTLLPLAERPDASNYTLVLTARALEQLSEREQAAQFLDRAARLTSRPSETIPAMLLRNSYGSPLDPAHPTMQLRTMLSEGRHAEAQSFMEAMEQEFGGSIDVQTLAGDTQTLAGATDAALVHYRRAQSLRSNWPLVRRMAAALDQSGETEQARRMLARHLLQNPREQAAAAMLGRMHRDAGNVARATALLRHAASFGAGRADPLLLADLAELELALQNPEDALFRAEEAHGMQRGNRRVASVLARVVELGGGDEANVQALRGKANGTGLGVLPAR